MLSEKPASAHVTPIRGSSSTNDVIPYNITINIITMAYNTSSRWCVNSSRMLKQKLRINTPSATKLETGSTDTNPRSFICRTSTYRNETNQRTTAQIINETGITI